MNYRSIYNMLKKIGGNAVICSKVEDLNKCKKIILPGVGSYDNAVEKLESSGFEKIIKDKVLSGSPFLGICLGMHLLGNKSEEGELRGLNLIPGKVVKFPQNNKLRVPHMGWNSVNFIDKVISKNLIGHNKFYFVHRYYFIPENPLHNGGYTTYGAKFSSFIKKENIYGVQFHPEKSHKYGMILLKNFKNLS